MTTTTSSPVANDQVAKEMMSWAQKTNECKIGSEPLQITTESGRTYRVEYVIETKDGKWTAAGDLRVKGLFQCRYCAEYVPGGNWMRVTSSSGQAPAPEVKLFEPLHMILLHPESVSALATNEKCIHVFGTIF